MTDKKKHARLIIVNPGGKKENAYKEPENDDNYAKTLVNFTLSRRTITLFQQENKQN